MIAIKIIISIIYIAAVILAGAISYVFRNSKDFSGQFVSFFSFVLCLVGTLGTCVLLYFIWCVPPAEP